MNPVRLDGIRGDNPMGFLAALGALSLATDGAEPQTTMAWEPAGASWSPVIAGPGFETADDVVAAIVQGHGQRDLELELGWQRPDIMKLTRGDVRALLSERMTDGRRRALDLAAAFVAELPPRRGPDALAPYTPLRLIPRIGRTRFIAAALEESKGGTKHLRDCLFQLWSYKRGVKDLRWDPGARVQARALMSEAPSLAGTVGVRCAPLLAIRGLSFFPLVPTRRAAVPPGMTSRDRLAWPIWSQPLSERAIRLMLSMRWLHPDEDDSAQAEQQLRAHGVVRRYVAPRVRLGGDDEMLGWGEPLLRPRADVLVRTPTEARV